MPGDLYYGDNLDIMRKRIANESIDLIYLDPPFNSDETYGLVHKGSKAQQDAFWDSWHWDESARIAYAELTVGGHGVPRELSEMMVALKAYLHPKHKDMLAYLSMLAIRIVEMKRVLRKTGSIYLHCDSTASHYIKLILDMIFGPECYRNDITWVRTNAHNYTSNMYQRVTDTIFFYTRSDEYRWHTPRTSTYSPAQMRRFKVDPANGRLYKAENMTMARAGKDRQVEWRGAKPKAGSVNRGWGMSLEERERLWADGRILTKSDGITPRLDGWKIYLDETDGGKEVACLWDDLPRLANKTDERTGYATQKPVQLLKRIIEASSEPSDVVLDPFCGCGTTIEAAEELGRKWIGIDIAIRAVDVMKDRLDDKFTTRIWTEHGEPTDIEQAVRLAKNPYDFQWWAVRMLGGSPPDGVKKKGADDGRDGDLILLDDAGVTRRGLISVKAHQGTKDDVKTLHDNVREKRYDFGVLAILYAPTQGMVDQAAEYGAALWAREHRGKVGHQIRIITAPEWLPPNEVKWAGKIQRPRSQSAPPPPEARAGETLHLPFAPRVPQMKKAKVRPPGTAKTVPYEAPPDQRRASAAERTSTRPPKK